MIGVGLDSEVPLSLKWFPPKTACSRRSFTGGISVSRPRSGDLTRRFLASRDPGTCVRARAGNEEGRGEEELYIRRSARQKQRSALNLARAGSDYASLGAKMRWDKEGGSERERLQHESGTTERRRQNCPLGRRIATERSRPQAALIIPHYSRWEMVWSSAGGEAHRSEEPRLLANHEWLALGCRVHVFSTLHWREETCRVQRKLSSK